MNNFTDIFGYIIACIFFFIILRPFWQWYYDINSLKKNQKETNEILNKILEEIKNQSH
jgi:hypothetical protein